MKLIKTNQEFILKSITDEILVHSKEIKDVIIFFLEHAYNFNELEKAILEFDSTGNNYADFGILGTLMYTKRTNFT